MYLVDPDTRMHVIPLFHGRAKDVFDAQLMQPCDGQRGGEVGEQHVVLIEFGEEIVGEVARVFPVHAVGEKVLFEPCSTGFLEPQMLFGVEGGRQTEEVGWLGEGNLE